MNQDKIKIRPDSLRPLFIELESNSLILATATAFLVSASKDTQLYLVTARHNFTGRNNDTAETLHPQCALPEKVSIHFHKRRSNAEPATFQKISIDLFDQNGNKAWIEHIVSGDVCDIAAISLELPDCIFPLPFILNNNPERITGPADPVSVLGFPFGMSSGNNLPIWATGYMATEPNIDYNDKPVFLIDCRSRTGQSGAPVISFRSDGVVGHNSFQGTWTAPSSDFLGVYTGRINEQSDLGIVWNRRAIIDLIT